MSKVACMICLTPCVGCSGKCKCGMTDRQVILSNGVLTKHPEFMEQATKLIELVKLGYWEEEIIDIISNNKEFEKANKLSGSTDYGMCEYAIGSASQGMWAKCIHCGKERFYGQGKPCGAKILIKKN